jgi:hypothetical protein
VDWEKGIEGWRRLADPAADNPRLKGDIARAKGRLQIPGSMPVYPEALQPARYVLEAAGYCWQVGKTSEMEKSTAFPIKAFLGTAPNIQWQQGPRGFRHLERDVSVGTGRDA